MFSHCSFKLSEIKRIPLVSSRSKSFNSHTWSYLLKQLSVVSPYFAEENVMRRIELSSAVSLKSSVAMSLVLRGDGADKMNASFAEACSFGPPWMSTFKNSWQGICPASSCQMDDLVRVTHSNHSFDQDERSLALW